MGDAAQPGTKEGKGQVSDFGGKTAVSLADREWGQG